MKTFAGIFAGIALVSSAVGCHCGGGGCYTPSYPAPAYGFGGGCPTGNCGVAPGAYPYGVAPQGMLTPQIDTVQARYPAQAHYPASPVLQNAYHRPMGVTYPQTAFAPLEPLPTY